MGPNDPPDDPDWLAYQAEESALDAALDARWERQVREVLEYLAENKASRGRPRGDRRYQIIAFVHNAGSTAKARALTAKKFGVTKSYVQRLTKKRT
jgi:hypothetical protein